MIKVFIIRSHLKTHITLDIIDRVLAPYFNLNKELENAAMCNNIDAAQYLLSVGANIHANKNAAVLHAIDYGHLDLVKFFIKNGAIVRLVLNEFDFLIAKKRGPFHMIEYFLSESIKQNVYTLIPIMQGHLELTMYFVSEGIIDVYSNDIAVHMAIKFNQVEIVKYLKDIGANFENVDLYLNFVKSKGISIDEEIVELVGVGGKNPVSTVPHVPSLTNINASYLRAANR